jgi:(+)-pinoresinol hydroxylase
MIKVGPNQIDKLNPGAAHGLNPAVLEQRTDLTPKMIESAVRNGLNFMPRFRKTEISNADLAAVTAYLVQK